MILMHILHAVYIFWLRLSISLRLDRCCGTAEISYSISESAGVSWFGKLTPHCIFLPTVTTIPMDSSCPSLAPRDGIYRGIKGWACLSVLVWHSHWPEIDLKAWVRLVLWASCFLYVYYEDMLMRRFLDYLIRGAVEMVSNPLSIRVVVCIHQKCSAEIQWIPLHFGRDQRLSRIFLI